MKTLNFSLGGRKCGVNIGSGASELVGEWAAGQEFSKKALVVTTPVVKKLFGKKIVENLRESGFKPVIAVVPDGEAAKSLSGANLLYEHCIRAGLDRSSPLIALGGGVVGDLTGFVAATFMRGLPLIQVPTTLLSQVDSSIGGKTGVDLPQGKNMAGSFYPASAIFSDTSFLATLPAREVSNGLAEAIKHGAALDERLFNFTEKNLAEILALDQNVLEQLVSKNVPVKMGVVRRDEREEKGARMLLNFGHTIGHAVETASKYRLAHGEAVAIGMIGEIIISRELAGLSEKDSQRVKKLVQEAGLPTKIPRNISARSVVSAAALDKKAINGVLRTTVLNRIGKASVAKVSNQVFKETVGALGVD